jgi:hypothetical protein
VVHDDPVAQLQRWEDAGGLWQVLLDHGGTLTVGLFRCDGGEQVGELRSGDPALIEFVAGRRSSLDD